MPRITMIVGVALIALGVGFFIAAGAGVKQMTALIPAAFGLPVAICGALGAKGDEKMRKHTAHIAVMLTLLGALGGVVRGIIGFTKPELRPMAITAQLLMGAICVLHVILSVRSFIAARKARESQAAQAPQTEQPTPSDD